MSIVFKLDAVAGVIFTVGHVIVKADDIRRYYEEILADPLYRPGLREPVDVRYGELEITGDEAFSLAQWFKEVLPVARIAVVAGSGAYGQIRMIHGWGGDDTAIQIFEDIGSARNELGLPPEEEQDRI